MHQDFANWEIINFSRNSDRKHSSELVTHTSVLVPARSQYVFLTAL